LHGNLNYGGESRPSKGLFSGRPADWVPVAANLWNGFPFNEDFRLQEYPSSGVLFETDMKTVTVVFARPVFMQKWIPSWFIAKIRIRKILLKNQLTVFFNLV